MFVSKKFELLFEDIVNMMPGVIFYGIILTYCITAALNVYFLPIPCYLSVPASIMLQFGRFACGCLLNKTYRTCIIIKVRMEMGNGTQRQQPDQRAVNR